MQCSLGAQVITRMGANAVVCCQWWCVEALFETLTANGLGLTTMQFG
jgi:hypothetical protein